MYIAYAPFGKQTHHTLNVNYNYDKKSPIYYNYIDYNSSL